MCGYTCRDPFDLALATESILLITDWDQHVPQRSSNMSCPFRYDEAAIALPRWLHWLHITNYEVAKFSELSSRHAISDIVKLTSALGWTTEPEM